MSEFPEQRRRDCGALIPMFFCGSMAGFGWLIVTVFGSRDASGLGMAALLCFGVFLGQVIGVETRKRK